MATENATSPAARTEVAATFLKTLYGEHSGATPGYLGVWNDRNKNTHHTEDTQEAAGKAVDLSKNANVYFNAGLQPEQLKPNQRGKAETASGIPGVWVDLDHATPYRKKTDLPPDRDALLELLAGFPLEPTIVVYTGGGLHAWWLFPEPWIFEGEEDRERAASLVKRLQATIRQEAARRGWHVDSTHDLARLMRLPGTTNYNGEEPVPVRISEEYRRRYSPAEIKEHTVEISPVKTPEPVKDGRNGKVSSSVGEIFERVRDSLPEWSATLIEQGHPPDVERSNKDHGVMCDLARAGLTKQEARTIFETHPVGVNGKHGERMDGDYLRNTIEAAFSEVESKGELGSRGLPTIVVNNRPQPEITAEVRRHVLAANNPPSLFWRGSSLVRTVRSSGGALEIEEVGGTALRHHLARVARYVKVFKKGTTTDVPPPKDLVEDCINDARKSGWPLPELEAATASPVLRPDGTILDTPGYDPATRSVYRPGSPDVAKVNVPDNPGPAELQAAVELIEELLWDFPFVDRASYANAVGLMLTPLIRPAMSFEEQVPMALLDATNPGTGKGLLLEIVSLIATGGTVPVTPIPGSETEMSKTLGAILGADAGALVFFDEISQPLGPPSLRSCLTASNVKLRILGKSEAPVLPVRATFAGAGNNVKLRHDFRRRVFHIRLDAKTPYPEERDDFRHPDLKRWVLENRGRLLSALFTVARS